MLQAEQRLPHATEAKAKRCFPIGRRSIAKHHPAAWNPQCTQRFRAEEFPLLCPKPNVMPRFRLDDVGAARWLLLHRWVDASPILPDAEHDSCNQRRMVSLSALSLLSTCVRLRQLRELHHNLKQATLNPCSRTQSAATDGSPTCCPSLMMRLCVMLRVPPQSSRCVGCLCCCCANSGVLVLFGPSCLGHYRPLRSASDKCSVRCRKKKEQRDKFYRKF